MRSKTHWIGEPTAATNGSASTVRSRTTWTLTIGEAPSRAAQPAGAATLSGGASASAARGAVASTTWAVATSSTAQPPSRGSSRVTLAPVRTVTPAAASAAAAASPCSRCNGTRDQPMSAAPRSVSRPTWNTIAARASEASSARALRVATPTRSHSASTVRASWP